MAPMTPDQRRARTEGRRATSIAWNRSMLTEIERGMADGLADLGMDIAADAVSQMRPGHLDAPPYGEGLVASSFVRVWVKGTLVLGRTDIMASRNKPKHVELPIDQVVMIVGFAAPHGHLLELGTIKRAARPFLTPAVTRNLPDTAAYVEKATAARLALGMKR